MDFDFSAFVNMAVIAGMIALIQAVKTILSANGIQMQSWGWLIVVCVLGIALGFVVNAERGFNLWQAIQLGFAYGGAASLFYQGGKAGANAVSKDNRDGQDN